MDKVLQTDWSSPDWHPLDDELLSYVDGELTAEEATKVRVHLEACWSCRTRSEKLQETIAAFIAYRGQVLKPASEPPNRWRTFHTKLHRVAEESGKRPFLASWRDFLARPFLASRLPLALAASLCLALLIAAFLTRSGKPPVVLASELLSRSAEGQAAQIRAVLKPVVYQKLRVRRMVPLRSNQPAQEESTTLEIWNNPLGGQVRVSGEGWSEIPGSNPHSRPHSTVTGKPLLQAHAASALWEELEETYRANRMEWRRPLSAASYQAWRAQVGDKYERVETSTLPDGSKAVRLKTVPEGPVPNGGIAEAGLLLRAKDLHPLEETLRVKAEGGDREYELAELNFHVVSLDTLGPYVFVEPPLFAAVTRPVVQPALALPSPAELADAEIEARVALHHASADLGEPVEIVRSPREVEVRGLVDTEQRKTELLAVLQGIRHLTPRITTIAEAASASTATTGEWGKVAASQAGQSNSDEKQPAAASNLPGSVDVSSRLPIQDQLEKYFDQLRRSTAASQKSGETDQSQSAIQQEIQRVSSQAVTLAEEALEHAWALRRLAERYPSDEVSKLSPESRRKLEGLVREHVQALLQRTQSYGALVKPVLLSLAAGQAGRSQADEELAAANWPAFSPSLFNTVSQVDRLTSSLFAGAALPSETESDQSGEVRLRVKTPEACVRDLLAALITLEHELPRIERQLAGTFLQ